tara:strand:- start:4547 stop:5500 length:954 start_codon:yes stop_codon:yes gene_type:complete
MNELEIINYLRKIAKNPSGLKLNDDVFFDKKKSLLASIDTYNENIHYLDFKRPDLILRKVVRSSISDIISKGVNPKYILLSFAGSKYHFNKKNITLMTMSLKKEQKKYNFSLIGGDTTSSRNSSFSICTFAYSNQIIQRKGCSVKDDIYITGNIGDSSVGLSIIKNKIKTDNKSKKYFVDKYFSPSLPYGFHNELKKFATSSIDVSDGLLIDLYKLVKNNKLSFNIEYDLIPKSTYLNKLFKQKKNLLKNHLFNGDDYQILFTAKNKYKNFILNRAKKWNQKVTKIGKITNQRHNYIIFRGKLLKITDYRGYIHNFK